MISKHISKNEGVYSTTAARLGLNNDPNEFEYCNMKLVAENIFEPLRSYVGGPIKINSFYRGAKLNKAIGGSSKSQHCQGRAIDIDDTYGYKTNAEMFEWVRNNLSFDQMIWEFGDDKNPNWIHISYVNKELNRNRCLKAYKKKGKTKYFVI